MKENKSITTQVVMPIELYEHLKAKAKQAGMSYSSYIKSLISQSERER